MDRRPTISAVNKQLLEAAFNGTLAEKVSKDEDVGPGTDAPSKDENAKQDSERLARLRKAVATVLKRDKIPAPGFHPIQGLREARLNGWSCKSVGRKAKGPERAEKYGPKFWENVAEEAKSPEKHVEQMTPDDCIDAYVKMQDPSMKGTVLEKLLQSNADVNTYDKVGRKFEPCDVIHTDFSLRMELQRFTMQLGAVLVRIVI